ncbi:MAG: glycosyl hydrolase family protein [Desulfobacteraceae bacterium]|nr:MAG: glycosyl hydrolase family protein [Desulfobacteraceae bacterium]
MKTIKLCFFLIIYNIIICSAASGNVVLTVGGSGQYATVQDAIRDAVPPNQYEIRVAQGTYTENITINNNINIGLQGGWNSDFTSRSDVPSLTVIDGGGRGSVFDIQAGSGNKIIFTIEGFTIRNGKAEQAFHGGGINVIASDSGSMITLLLIHNIISGNTSSDRGGGALIYASQSASVNVGVTDNTISDNTTNNEGGGLRIGAGGGGSTVGTLTGNIITRNYVKEDLDAGGIGTYADSGGKTTLFLKNNVITQNEAAHGGGLLGYAQGTDSLVDITLINNIIANNRARMQGGAIKTCNGVTPPPPTTLPGGSVYWKLTNNTITGNTAGIEGGVGGITLYSGSSAGDGGLSSLSSRNDIIWGNTDPHGNIQIYVGVAPGKSGVSTASILYSDVGATQIDGAGIYTSEHTINQDPKFVDHANLVFFLQDDSPAIDAADPNQNYNDCVRPPGKGTMRGDMGAYGGPNNCTITQTGFNAALYFPHVATSLPWQTEIAIINTSDQTVTGTLRGLSNGGQLVDTKDITLYAHGRMQIIVADEFTNHTNIGYIIFDTNSTAAQGYTKFYQAGTYRAAIPAVKEVNTSDIYISHIASNADWWTGISLVNTTTATKQLTITFNNGQSVPYTFNANEHKAFTIENLFNNQPQPDIQSAVITNASGIIGLELFGSIGGGNQLDGILLTDDTASTIYYPHVASNDTWWTGIVAYNPSESACTITVTPYTVQGAPLSPTILSILGKGKYIGLVSGLGLPDETAWFKIDSTQPLTGFELFATYDGKQLAAYSGSGAKTGVFAKIEKNGWTGIAFVNMEASTASVTLTAYNDNGSAVATQVLPVGVYAKVVNLAENIFSQDIRSATYIAYSSDRNVVGFQLNGTSDGMMLDGLPGLAGTITLLHDDFNGSTVTASNWHIPTWVSPTDGTFVGQTQFRCSQNAALPAVSTGNAIIALDTNNPTGSSFYGTDLISNQSFALGRGITVTVRAKMDAPIPVGIVGGIFLYAPPAGTSNTLHDEIDFELLSNDPNHVLTNIYGNEPLGAGHPASYAFASGSATDYHIYQIQWLPGQVSWYVDGNLVRTVTTQSPIPAGPMYLHFNVWVPGSDFAAAYDQNLHWTTSPSANQTFSMSVDWVTVQ